MLIFVAMETPFGYSRPVIDCTSKDHDGVYKESTGYKEDPEESKVRKARNKLASKRKAKEDGKIIRK